MNKTKERPILFSGPMVRAILDGRKTQTRRIVKAKDSEPSRCVTLPMLMKNVNEWRLQDGRWFGIDGWDTLVFCDCPYGKTGDRLWVRETFGIDPWAHKKGHEKYLYRADGKIDPDYPVKWKSSIHMPRVVSRITLEVLSVRIERAMDITESEAKAEGAATLEHFEKAKSGHPLQPHRAAFAWLWNSINGDGSWAANPWVWVVEFQKTEGPK